MCSTIRSVQQHAVRQSSKKKTAHFKGVWFLQETVYHLEECTRELKTQLKLQKLKTKEMEETRDSLTKQLHLYK